MPSSFKLAAVVATALCLASLLTSAHSTLFVEGTVYCDTCRVEFPTKLSTPISSAKVQLECRSRENGTLTYSATATADKNGIYAIPVDGDHEEDICEVKLGKSPDPECSELFKSVDNARVLITKNVGVVEPKRFVNPIGFMRKQALTGCGEVLKQMGFLPVDVQV